MIDETIIRQTAEKLFDEIQFAEQPSGLYDPLRYMIAIGGKRIRPRLCLTAYSLFKDSIGEELTAPVQALEVFHTFTLIHDDIMDKSPMRRGKPTVWSKWSDDTAILSGDVMLIDAYRRIAKAPAAVLDRCLDLFSRTAAEVCEGQQYDMDFENADAVPMCDYKRMIGLKTAVLLACSAEMGAILAGADDAQCKALYRYGYELGMAFQIADDWLDAYGDEKLFGKPIGGDILNEKKSWLTVRALEISGDKDAFLKAFKAKAENAAEKEAKIREVRGIYDSLGVGEDAKKEIELFNARALEAVAGFSKEQRAVLTSFAERLVGRVK